MSREIKFKAWNELADGGEMVTEENSGLRSYQILERFSIVMQYTGMKDRNGVEIYEKDYIRFRFNNGPVKKGIVTFEQCMFLVNTDDSYSLNRISYIEVLGNIHENPELIR
jgi:hypothetical protein